MSQKLVNMHRPFCCLIVGHTESGKTCFLLQLLEKEFYQYFDRIYILCPSLYRNKTYITWKYFYDQNFFPNDCKGDIFEQFLKLTREESKDSNTLIIIDDLASSREIKKQSSELTELTMGGRHEGLSVIVLTQQYTSIA